MYMYIITEMIYHKCCIVFTEDRWLNPHFCLQFLKVFSIHEIYLNQNPHLLNIFIGSTSTSVLNFFFKDLNN
jgi:hypothetical protein